MASQGGLLGLSGSSGDIRDLEQAADAGDAGSRLALDVFVQEIRRHLGGMLVALGGADAIVFTGGIGEKGNRIRAAVCEGSGSTWESFIDPVANDAVLANRRSMRRTVVRRCG